MGGRNVYEMANEVKEYLGQGVADPNAKISKHYNRDQWLRNNRKALSRFVQDPESYSIHSLVLTADEIPLTYMKKHGISLPVRSFPLLRKDGLLCLQNL